MFLLYFHILGPENSTFNQGLLFTILPSPRDMHTYIHMYESFTGRVVSGLSKEARKAS